MMEVGCNNNNHVNVTIINHPPVITIESWDVNHSQSWVVYHIVIHTLVVDREDTSMYRTRRYRKFQR